MVTNETLTDETQQGNRSTTLLEICIEVSYAKHFDPGVKTLNTEISRGASEYRDSQPDKTIFPTKKPTREDASTDMYRESASLRNQGRHHG